MRLTKKLAAVLVAMIGISGVGLAMAQDANALASGRVLADPCLNFRAGYDHNTGWDTMLGCIPINTTVAIECVNDGLLVYGPYGSETIWDRVTWSGMTGYVSDAWVYTGSNGAVAPACGATAAPPAPEPVPLAPVVGHQSWVSGEQAVRQGCANVMFVAVRGSGETNGPGKEVAAVANQVNVSLSQSISLRQVYIDYTSATVPSIFTPGQGPSWYFASIDDGVTRLRTALSDSSRRCPDEKWVISGYSQGALVAHLIAKEFADTTHLAAVVMIADPARRTSGNGQDFGSAGAHKGIYTQLIQDSPLPSLWSGKTLSVCDSRDVICDLGSTYYKSVALIGGVLAATPAVKNGADIHTSYLSRSTELTNAGSVAASKARRATGL